MHVRTNTISFGNSLLLLAMVAGVLNIDLFECHAVSGYDDHRVLYRIELVLNAEAPSQSPVLSVPEDRPGNDVVEARILPLHFCGTCFHTALFVVQKTRRVNSRPTYSSHNHTRSFNIPHQNSDEDEAFISPVDVA